MYSPLPRKNKLNRTTTKRKLISLRSTKNYFLSARSRMCYVTDVKITFHVVGICKFWVTFWFNWQLQRDSKIDKFD